jgi:monofunctional biosynthetic peptidoglycan transglycosylase
MISSLGTPALGAAVVNGKHLLDFSGAEVRKWNVVNDGVMGGLSRSSIMRTSDGTGIFTGHVSLDNNGGFASVRTFVDGEKLAGMYGVTMRVRGDGRRYQLRFRTDNRFDGVAYRAEFTTSGDGWQLMTLPFEAFEPTFRGRVFKDMPALDPSAIRQMSFLIADKKEGPFALEVDWMQAFKAEWILPN